MILQVALLLASLTCAWFIISLILKRNDVADMAWGFNAVCISAFLFASYAAESVTARTIATLIIVWGVRLSWHIGRRIARTDEDHRYATWRKQWGTWFIVRSFLQVYVLQSVLLFIVISPLLIASRSSDTRIGPVAMVGTAVWIIGFIVETMADRQLSAFVRDAKSKGKLMMNGLWRYSRHPNYFGEVVQWWGIGIIAFAAASAWLSFAGPISITLLILFVSGVPLAEARMATKPGFAEYKKRTSIFVPLNPRTK